MSFICLRIRPEETPARFSRNSSSVQAGWRWMWASRTRQGGGSGVRSGRWSVSRHRSAVRPGPSRLVRPWSGRFGARSCCGGKRPSIRLRPGVGFLRWIRFGQGASGTAQSTLRRGQQSVDPAYFLLLTCGDVLLYTWTLQRQLSPALDSSFTRICTSSGLSRSSSLSAIA